MIRYRTQSHYPIARTKPGVSGEVGSSVNICKTLVLIPQPPRMRIEHSIRYTIPSSSLNARMVMMISCWSYVLATSGHIRKGVMVLLMIVVFTRQLTVGIISKQTNLHSKAGSPFMRRYCIYILNRYM